MRAPRGALCGLAARIPAVNDAAEGRRLKRRREIESMGPRYQIPITFAIKSGVFLKQWELGWALPARADSSPVQAGGDRALMRNRAGEVGLGAAALLHIAHETIEPCETIELLGVAHLRRV